MQRCSYCSRELRFDGRCSECDARYPTFWPLLIGMSLVGVVVLFFIAAAILGGFAAG